MRADTAGRIDRCDGYQNPLMAIEALAPVNGATATGVGAVACSGLERV